MRSYPRASITVPLLAALLSGCSPAVEQATNTVQAGYPVTIENCGREVTVQRPPERIVSLNQGSTEMLLSLGAADRMVGSAGWTDPIKTSLEADNARVKRLANQAPSYEALLDAEPDLVTASFPDTLGAGGVTTPEDLQKLGVPAYVSAVECTKEAGSSDGARSSTLEIDAVFTEIRDLAALINRRAEGDTIIADMKDRLAALAATKPADGTTALYWFANSESPYLAGCCGGPGIISRTLGLKNAFDDAREDWPQISWETVAQRDPDVLILGDLTRKSQTAESAAAKIAFLESNPVTREMTAVKNKRYIALAGAELNPSIRIVDAMETVVAGLREHGLTP
ncbi:ABC transporter substrate-binding protein [Mycolicibacterium komossense]|uniref:ABC transporter substrate-binding protein n=1 Tax=Mycolicibacterium komossense TaxID=1779 RepID=A0ABT3CFE1_9MYCO|nr:ABC transporter substrate-binding protein [Mycolicibacterium komossense]MCV7228185.1 ABC transporter substrate-binding protein [Mycolicibacterium komossense]